MEYWRTGILEYWRTSEIVEYWITIEDLLLLVLVQHLEVFIVPVLVTTSRAFHCSAEQKVLFGPITI